MMISRFCHEACTHRRFQQVVIGLILGNAILMGLETSPSFRELLGETALWWIHALFQGLFVVEIAVRIVARGPNPALFFRDPWNAFDFTVVALSLLPAAGALATVARLARVLRIARLVTAYPELKLIIGTMLRSIPSMGHVIALMGLLMYVYAIIGFYKFGHIDLENWGNLGRAFRSLFQILTLDGWAELQRPVASVLPWSWLFFYSYTIIAVFVVVNLFIAVVINNLDQVQRESRAAAAAADGAESRKAQLESMRSLIQQLSDRIDSLERN